MADSSAQPVEDSSVGGEPAPREIVDAPTEAQSEGESMTTDTVCTKLSEAPDADSAERPATKALRFSELGLDAPLHDTPLEVASDGPRITSARASLRVDKADVANTPLQRFQVASTVAFPGVSAMPEAHSGQVLLGYFSKVVPGMVEFKMDGAVGDVDVTYFVPISKDGAEILRHLSQVPIVCEDEEEDDDEQEQEQQAGSRQEPGPYQVPLVWGCLSADPGTCCKAYCCCCVTAQLVVEGPGPPCPPCHAQLV